MSMHELLRSLSERRPVFHSEADFQHALAWEMQLASRSASIRLEQQVAAQGNRVHLDLLVKDQAKHIAVELKYKTKKASIFCNDEQFLLRNQGARDLGRYDFLKDISRIERYVAAHLGAEGYVILVTNDQTYWQESKKAQSVDSAFHIYEGRIINGALAWGARASDGTMRSREAAIQIDGSYCLSWYDYSLVDQSLFRYVLVHVS